MNWILKSDSPTAYFFAIANGRRRRCSIDILLINGVSVFDQAQILSHVVDLFSSLLSTKPASGLSISSSPWDASARISRADHDTLLLSLSEDEIWEVIR